MAGESTQQYQPIVGVIMGSRSDWETMRHVSETLTALEVAHECKVVSAHRTPQRLYDYATGAVGRGLKAIIAGADHGPRLPTQTGRPVWVSLGVDY